jgi:hypothetical protein
MGVSNANPTVLPNTCKFAHAICGEFASVVTGRLHCFRKSALLSQICTAFANPALLSQICTAFANLHCFTQTCTAFEKPALLSKLNNHYYAPSLQCSGGTL